MKIIKINPPRNLQGDQKEVKGMQNITELRVPRSEIVRAFKVRRAVINEWETIGIIPAPEKDERGWNYYGVEHLKAIAKRYLQRGRELPTEAIELLKNSGIDLKELECEINEEEGKKNCGDQSSNREGTHGQT